MNKQKKPSFFVTIIALGVFITIFGPLLEVLVGIIIISIIAALVYFIYKFLKQQQQKNTDTTSTFIDETEKRHQDYLFYSNFIKNNSLQEATSKHVPEVPFVVSFEFENNVDSFDKNFLEVFAYAETYNTIQLQNKFLDSYFNKILTVEDLDTDVKNRANRAKEYVELVQGIKERLHFTKASQTGYTDDSYYFFINSKETSGIVDSMRGHDFEEHYTNSLQWNDFNSIEITKEKKNMGFSDIFKGRHYKTELECLQQQYNNLQAAITPEMRNGIALQNKINQLENSIAEHNQKIKKLQIEINKQENILTSLNNEITQKKSEIAWLDDEILVQEFGLYKPQFDFANSIDYKEALADTRYEQKAMIKNKTAVLGNTDWHVDGSISKGRKMVSDIQKLLLRAFNNECDELVSKVKYTNFDASFNKIHKSAETISKLGTTMGISISRNYIALKIKELRLAFEYQQKKQEEKEEQKAARAEMREAARLQKEIEEQRKKIEKEQTHYQTVYEKLLKQLEGNPENRDLLIRKSELEAQLSDIDKAIKDIDYREANHRAGYVYIISNIGAFGENIYKIGMTRRLSPQERVDELGDASVPFNFDVHAMIFSDNAPALESALHKAFENRKLNLVNTRREFFNVTLDEIKDVVKKNFDKTVEFIDVPDAEQFRVSQKMKQSSFNSNNSGN